MIPGNKNFSRIFRNDLYIFQDEMSIEINKARSLVNYGGEQQALLVSRQRERERGRLRKYNCVEKQGVGKDGVQETAHRFFSH